MYTKTGDKGTSSLYNGTRASKTDAVFAALGDTDELNAAIGLAREHCAELSDVGSLVDQLVVIQSRLLDAGSAIATPTSSSSEAQLERVTFDEAHVEVLEEWIDEMDETLPPLKNFILPVRSHPERSTLHPLTPNNPPARSLAVWQQHTSTWRG